MKDYITVNNSDLRNMKMALAGCLFWLTLFMCALALFLGGSLDALVGYLLAHY